MFIMTACLPKKRLRRAALSAMLCCVAILVGFFCLRSLQSVSASAEVQRIRSEDDRIAYLEHLGWTVDPEPLAIEELLIPETFDDSYQEYLELQQSQGFDLTAYCGKRVKRYTYQITNYPTGETGIQAALLIYKNRIVGGEVLSPAPDGWIHGLELPET